MVFVCFFLPRREQLVIQTEKSEQHPDEGFQKKVPRATRPVVVSPYSSEGQAGVHVRKRTENPSQKSLSSKALNSSMHLWWFFTYSFFSFFSLPKRDSTQNTISKVDLKEHLLFHCLIYTVSILSPRLFFFLFFFFCHFLRKKNAVPRQHPRWCLWKPSIRKSKRLGYLPTSQGSCL